MPIARSVVLTAGLAGSRPSTRQPLPGTQELRVGAGFLSRTVIAILATQNRAASPKHTNRKQV